MLQVFVLLVLAILACAKHVAPPAQAQSAPKSPLSRPSDISSIQSGEDVIHVDVPKSHVFYSNYAKSVASSYGEMGFDRPVVRRQTKYKTHSKTNPGRRLWSGPAAAVHGQPRERDNSKTIKGIQARGSDGYPTEFEPLENPVGPDNCLECGPWGTNNPASIDLFTTNYFINNMLATQEQLLNKCVFYTAVFHTADYVKWNLAYPLHQFNLNYKAALSHAATDYCCKNGFWSIWMLWPGKSERGENPGNTIDPTRPNFWEVYVPGSWLYGIVENNQQSTYFSTMSATMALRCGGVIRVMSIDILHMNKYTPSIWLDHELRTLRERRATETGRYYPTQLIGIDATTLEQYDINWDDLSAKSKLKRGDPAWMDPEELRHMNKRSTCDSAIAYEDAQNGDWFG